MLKPIKFNNIPGDKVFFTGCSHFRHSPPWHPSLYESRGFSKIEDHDIWLLKEYQKLSPDSIVFILGDFCLNTDENDAQNLFNQIPCKKYYIEGNHESQVSKYYRKLVIDKFQREDFDVFPLTDERNNLTFLGSYAEVIVNGQFIVLNHFPFAIWNKSHHSSWNIHSHNHATFKESLPEYPYFKRLDVGIDTAKKIFSFRDVQKIMAGKQIKQLDHHTDGIN